MQNKINSETDDSKFDKYVKYKLILPIVILVISALFFSMLGNEQFMSQLLLKALDKSISLIVIAVGAALGILIRLLFSKTPPSAL